MRIVQIKPVQQLFWEKR